MQSYAPDADEVSEYTRSQAAELTGLGGEELDAWLRGQPERTLNSGSFHSEETLSTSYLRWLVKTRGFSGFEITHFLAYRFDDHAREFVEPLLRKRHEVKRAGSVPHAEALKLVANSDYGYQGLEACKYDDCRLVTGANLGRLRRTSLLHLSLKHVTLVGLVKTAPKKSGRAGGGGKRRRRARRRRRGGRDLLDDEASDDDDDDDDDDGEDDGDDEGEADFGDHTYARGAGRGASEGESPSYDFLYAVVTSGAEKAVKNCLPKAAAILGNSKVIFLSHLHTLLVCLDPAKAEICYTDTDSCVFSTTHERLEDNLSPDRLDDWRRADIMADEDGPESCHGKMKLEGTFRAGLFKTLKIYRLFTGDDYEGEFAAQQCYTRCKGVSRALAKTIPNSVFASEFLGRVVVHRTCLRPARTGQILVSHEARSLSRPLNLKRRVTPDGLHSFPLSYVADGSSGGSLQEQA